MSAPVIAVPDAVARTEQELDGVFSALHAEFDVSTDPQVVDDVVTGVVRRFLSVKVQSFVPLLVRRYAREELLSRAVS